MKKFVTAVAAVGLMSLGACGHQNKAAENVASTGEKTADNLEDMADNAATSNQADMLENKADVVRTVTDNKADAMEHAAENGASNAMVNKVGNATK